MELSIDISGEISDLINNSLSDGYPCFLGTASASGEPQISMKGSVIAYDSETLAYWERAKRSAMQNIKENPKVVIFYRNTEKRLNWRFQGTAEIVESDRVRDDVMNRIPRAELDRDPERVGVAVLVNIYRITELSGNILQQA
jgi:predicted pyridoxine 5'-phosphate oxidase superfamily flavin-nucleotide-binding protein